MLSGTSCSEDTDGADKMQPKKLVVPRNYCMGGQAGSYHDLRQSYCVDCDKLPPDAYHGKSLDVSKMRRKKSKNQPQHCPSCHCPPVVTRPGRSSTRRANMYQDMEAFLNNYEDTLEDSDCQKFKYVPSDLRASWYPSGCSQAPPNLQQLRKRQTSRHRRQCKKECEEIISTIIANDLNAGVNNIGDVCCMCYGEIACKDEQVGRGNTDRDVTERCVQHKRERITWREPLLRHRPENASKGERIMCEKYESGDNEDDTEVLHGMKSLKLHEPKDPRKTGLKINSKMIAAEAWQDQTAGVAHDVLHRLETCAVRTVSGKRNDQELKIAKNEGTDRSKDGILAKEKEDRSICGKIGNRLTSRPDYASAQDKESTIAGSKTSRRDERREENTCFEATTPKNEDEEDEEETQQSRKNIYAGGDLDMHVHKNDVIGSLLRVIANAVDDRTVKQKNEESSEGALTEQGISMELIRVLQSELAHPLAEDSLNYLASRSDCIRLLKMRQWKHIKLIHSELAELYSLQMLLDSCPSRQCLPSTVENHSHAVEQQKDEEQQRQPNE